MHPNRASASMSWVDSEKWRILQLFANKNALMSKARSKQKLRPHSNLKRGGDLASINLWVARWSANENLPEKD
jgi:hypothetical protein